MTPFLRPLSTALIVAGAALLLASQGQRPEPLPDHPPPRTKNMQEEMLKADHKNNLKDAATLADLAEQLKAELEKNDRHVLSIASLKKTEEIEKLAKRIRGRLKRY